MGKLTTFPSVLSSIDDLSLDQIEGLLSLARKIKNKDYLGIPFGTTGPIIATYFLEPSTRTMHSFSIAIHKLGGKHLRFEANSSSLVKGETFKETLRTFASQGVSLCITRTSENDFFEPYKDAPPIRLINGGDGTCEHPTQALLDLFTILEYDKNARGKTLTLVGDITHSRVSNSLIKILKKYGIKVILCGPVEMLPKEAEGVDLTQDLDTALDKTDFLYLLRIQKERHANTVDGAIDFHTLYGINLPRLSRLNKKIPVFHPGPVNIGVELTHEVLDSDYYMGYKQVENSIYMRMALIKAMLKNKDTNVGTFKSFS